jgi:hypothetical protein
MSKFIESCIRGEALLEDIDDFVDEWHESSVEEPLHKFLGMTKNEYSLWVADPDVLPFIVVAHREYRNVSDVIDDFEALPMAARSNGPVKAQKLVAWLKSEGLWD